MTMTQEVVGVRDTAGVYLDDLVPGDVLLITTMNSRYSLLYLGFGAAKISGNPQACQGAQVVIILGSTWGGSTFPTGFIGVGIPLEFQLPRSRKMMRTTPIQAIRHLRTHLPRGPLKMCGGGCFRIPGRTFPMLGLYKRLRTDKEHL